MTSLNSDTPLRRPTAAPFWVWLAVIAGLTLCAAGAGAGLGVAVRAGERQTAVPELPGKPGNGDTALQEVPPVVTNLAEPAGAWVRVQVSFIFDRNTLRKPEAMAAEIGEDLLGLMRTLTLEQIGGASGLQHLREDLNERAAVRSGGLVREVLLESVVVQ